MSVPPSRHPLHHRHQRAALLALAEGQGLGYVLDSVPYGLVWPEQERPDRGGPDAADALRVALLHAAALDLTELEVSPPLPPPAFSPAGLRLLPAGEPVDRAPALQAARLAVVLSRLAGGQALSTADIRTLCGAHPLPLTPGVVIHADGSADKADGSLSVGYSLNGVPYATFLGREGGHEHRAEREAIRVALAHAFALGHTRFHVRSDHKFHVRRYAEDLVYRGRQKSPSLERLDALVEGLGDAVSFEYTETNDTDAPHRLAVHARALHRLAVGEPLSRAQGVALRRVHFARKVGGGVLY